MADNSTNQHDEKRLQMRVAQGTAKEGALKEGALKEGALKEGGLKEGGLKGGDIKEGERLYRLKRWDMALQELLLVNSENSTPEENIQLAYYMGLCYTKLERYDDALLYLEQVVTTEDNPLRMYQCRMTLAYIYIITNRTKMAEFELQRLSKSGFESAQLFSAMAYIAWSQKQYRNSIQLYEKALALDTKNTTALNGLGYILSDANLDPAKGLLFCKKAVELKPGIAAYLDSLGWAYYKTGDLAEARSWLLKALTVSPNNKEIKEHLKKVTGPL